MDGGIIPTLTTVGVIVALALNLLNLRGKMHENNPAMIELRMNVKHIRETVDKQDVVMSQLSGNVKELNERMVKVEMDVKAAHRRLDERKNDVR